MPLGVARGTVQARLDRLARDGVVAGFGPEIDPAALGYGVTAFVTLQLRQAGGHDPVAARLAQVPEVIEAHTITGPGDMLCRIVARSNTDLQRVIDEIVDVGGVERASSVISLANQIPYRTLPWCAPPPRKRTNERRPLRFIRLEASEPQRAPRKPPSGVLLGALGEAAFPWVRRVARASRRTVCPRLPRSLSQAAP